jgi:predicted DNA-binding transcriptional regulator YafY
MPSNKNAQIRYQILDRCLSNRGRRWTWKNLLDEVNKVLAETDPSAEGIGKTTLFADIQDLEYRVYSADIERIKEGRTTYYRYGDPDFSINNQPLSDMEVQKLKSAIQILSRFSGNPQFEWIHEMIPALESKMGLVKVDRPVMTFENNPDYEGLSYITPVFNAIVNKRVLNCTYQDFRSSLPYEIIIHPYHLKQYNKRWYMVGLNPGRNRIEHLALDRIKGLKEEDITYIEDDRDWQEYFSDFIGVTRLEGAPVEVRIRIFDEVQAAYIRTNPLHETQKPIRQVGEGYETSFKVIPNFELEKLLLSFGEKIRVEAPVSLVENIYRRLKAANSNYGAGE